MLDMARISLEALRNDQRAALRRVETSLSSLKNQGGEYAEQHRTLIACRREICAVIDKHLPSSAAHSASGSSNLAGEITPPRTSEQA